MENDIFAALMPVIVGGLTNKIIEETNVSEDEAFENCIIPIYMLHWKMRK